MSEVNPIALILTGIGSICATVAVLSYYGYLHIAKPEDALLLVLLLFFLSCMFCFPASNVSNLIGFR